MNAEQFGYPRLEFYSTPSTMDIAREQALRGISHGALVTATHQTAGRGRRGATWNDQPGESALMSFVLKPNVPVAEIWRISFIASLACVRFLRLVGFEAAQVKWPNDLVIGGKKVGGLISELVSIPVDSLVVILGIGINVRQTSFAQSDGYVLPPTSLLLSSTEAKVDCPNVRQVIDGVAANLGRCFDAHISSGGALINAWRAYQMSGQRQIGVDASTGERVDGVYRDVRPADGAGLIEREGGVLTAVLPAAS